MQFILKHFEKCVLLILLVITTMASDSVREFSVYAVVIGAIWFFAVQFEKWWKSR